ncbi:hypothetical protein YC2023_071158 [Brassica napus]
MVGDALKVVKIRNLVSGFIRSKKKAKGKREKREKRENAWEESTDVRRRVCARAGAGGSLICRSSLGYPLCASICCLIRYIFGSGLGFYRRERTVYGGFQTALRRRRSSFRGVEAPFSSAPPAKLPGGRGSHSSAPSDLAPRGEGVLYLASSALVFSSSA